MTTSSSPLRRAALVLLSLGTVASAVAFTFILNDATGLPLKWPAGALPIRIMLGDSPTLFDGSTFNTSARTAAQTWNAVIDSVQFTTTFATGTAGNNNSVNEVAFSATMFGRDFGEDVLAVTLGGRIVGNQRTEADILINSAVSWDSFRGPNFGHGGKRDLQRVVIHELGHVLGLDHPDEATPAQTVSAIMNSSISQFVDSLKPDDVEGAQALYGPPGAPANDAFANATTITLNTTGTRTVTGFNSSASKETGEPRHADNSGGRSVWWRWTALAPGNVTIDTVGSYYDTTLGVYTGTSVSTLTKIVDNDDIDLGVIQASRVSFSATAGTVYRLAVDGYNNGDQDSTDHHGPDNGGITLTLQFTSTGASMPIITTQPANLSVTSGGSASFSVVATSATTPTYQWLFNGTAISGATNSTYNIASATSAQAGTYAVTLTNPVGTVTSDNATLTVTAPVVVTPAPSGGGGGGGGGAPSTWFLGLLSALGLVRVRRFRSRA